VSRVCEEFHCLPSQAVRELENDPERLALKILPLRAYAKAKEIYDRARNKMDLPESPLIDEVTINDFVLHRRRLVRQE
jgi:hypothetical protein